MADDTPHRFQRSRPGQHSRPAPEAPAPAEPKLAYNAGAVSLGTEDAYRGASNFLSSVDGALGTDLTGKFQSAAREIIPQMETAARDKMQANLNELAKTDLPVANATAAAINDAALGTERTTVSQGVQPASPEDKGITQQLATALGNSLDDIKQFFAAQNIVFTDVASGQSVSPASTASVAQQGGPETGRG